jgi:FecR protein
MNDGSVMSLAENTTLRIDAYALNSSGQRQSAAVSLGGGLIRAVTAPGSQSSGFEVNTAVSTSGARSTDWFAGVLTASPLPGSRLNSLPPGTAYVVVLSGTVALTSRATGRAVLIQPRYGSAVLAGQDPHPPELHTQAQLDRLLARTELP